MLWTIVITAAYARYPEAGFVDSTEGHVRCHYERDTDASRCDDVVIWAEQAWVTQIDGLGFTAPLPDDGVGGSDALDIYITREAGGAGSAFVDCDGGDPACEDPDPTDDVDGAPSFVVIDPRTASDDFPLFTYHEFQHTTQYARDYTEPFLALWEGTAVACEHWTAPGWPTSAPDFGDYQATPWLSVILQDGYFLADTGFSDGSWYEYGAVAWVFFMDDRYGDGLGSIGPALWDEAGKPGANVLDAWQTLSGDREASLLEFAADRARMGTAAGPAYAAFAGVYGVAWREETPIDAPAAPSYPPYPLGMSLYDASGPGEIAFDGDPSVRWALLAVTDSDAIELDPHGSVDLDGDWTLVVINLGPDGFVATDPLEPASFTLLLSGVEETTQSCGCDASSHGGLAFGVLGLALARRRRR